MEAKKAYRGALRLMLRMPWLLATIIDKKGWPDNAIRTNFAYKNRFPELADKINHKTLDNYLPMNSYSTRVHDVIACPKGALYYYDPDTKEACQVQGIMKLVKDEKVRREVWHQEWEIQCPGGPDGDEYALVHFEGTHLKYYDGVSDSYWGPIEADEEK